VVAGEVAKSRVSTNSFHFVCKVDGLGLSRLFRVRATLLKNSSPYLLHPTSSPPYPSPSHPTYHPTMLSSTTLVLGSALPALKKVLLEENMPVVLDEAMKHNGLAVEMAVLYLMRNYTFDLKALLKYLEGSSRLPYLVTSLYILTCIVILTYP
jgi:hypothetical protein